MYCILCNCVLCICIFVFLYNLYLYYYIQAKLNLFSVSAPRRTSLYSYCILHSQYMCMVCLFICITIYFVFCICVFISLYTSQQLNLFSVLMPRRPSMYLCCVLYLWYLCNVYSCICVDCIFCIVYLCICKATSEPTAESFLRPNAQTPFFPLHCNVLQSRANFWLL